MCAFDLLPVVMTSLAFVLVDSKDRCSGRLLGVVLPVLPAIHRIIHYSVRHLSAILRNIRFSNKIALPNCCIYLTD